MASNVTPIAIPATDQMLTGTPTILYGWSIRENAGTPAAAEALLRSGSAVGPIVGVIDLAANGSTTVWFGPQGLRVPDGIFVDAIAGSLEGAIYVS